MTNEIDNSLKVIGVSLTGEEVAIVNSHVEQTGLGPKGFSAGLRQIIRAWAEQRAQSNQPQPTQKEQA